MIIPPIVIIILVALGASCITQLINKLMVNEKYVDGARAKMKGLQEKLKTITDIKSPDFTKAQDELLDINFNIMKQQMKPTFVTFIPYLFLYWLMSSTFAYAAMDIGSNVTLKITGTGNYAIDCISFNQTVTGSYEGVHVLSAGDCHFSVANVTTNQSVLGKKEIVSQSIGSNEISLIPSKNRVIPLPVSLPYVGDALGWLGTFVLFSLIFSLVLGKALKGKYLRKWEQ
jgi:uncharacterized membrane protein (DUF106 family)